VLERLEHPWIEHERFLGTISNEIAVTPAPTAASITSAAVVGDKKEIVIAPFFNDFI
jgi:hypothetical protein